MLWFTVFYIMFLMSIVTILTSHKVSKVRWTIPVNVVMLVVILVFRHNKTLKTKLWNIF